MGAYHKSIWAFIGKLSSGEVSAERTGNIYHSSKIIHKHHKNLYVILIFGILNLLITFSYSDQQQLNPLQRSDSLESTQSEREFRKKYQAITHRMVHRKSSAVMYSKILERTFGN